MIIRPDGFSLLLITQPDHAALAGRLMRAWRSDGLIDSARRPQILVAIEEHDNGWRDVDEAPLVDASTGRLLDFVEAPAAVRQGLWPQGVARLSRTPYAAALVAQHAVSVYGRYRSDHGWSAFFREMEDARDRCLRAAEPVTPAPVTPEQLAEDYRFVRLGDLASLTFCNGWTEPQADAAGYTTRLENAHLLDEARLIVTPDPFGGREVPFAITARRLPARAYESSSDARTAFRAAPTVALTGVASGG